jgi:hypothetical protein
MVLVDLDEQNITDLARILEHHEQIILNSDEYDHYHKGIVSGVRQEILAKIKEAETRVEQIYIDQCTCQYCKTVVDPKEIKIFERDHYIYEPSRLCEEIEPVTRGKEKMSIFVALV